MTVLTNARVVQGVTGGIAAYEAADRVSKLTRASALVDVILADTAREFIGATTFEGLTQRLELIAERDGV